MVDGGHDVLDGDRVEIGFGGGGVGAAEDVAFGDAAACEHGGEDAGEVVAACGAVDFGGAAEFGSDEDERAVEEPLFFEVGDESGEGLVEGRELFFDTVGDAGVVVPAVVGDGDEADAGGDETTGEEEAHASGGFAVSVDGGGGFGGEVEGFACFRGADERVGLLVEFVHGAEGVGVGFE